MSKKKRRARLVPLAAAVRAVHLDVDVAALVAQRRLIVDGVVVHNTRALVRSDASVRVIHQTLLRGQIKLRHALATFGTDVRGATALDIGAAAGGSTAALLEAGAARVYALDVGHGQLRGWLRQDGRVIDLEGHNLSQLNTMLVRHRVDVVTIDLSYLPRAMPSLRYEQYGSHLTLGWWLSSSRRSSSEATP